MVFFGTPFRGAGGLDPTVMLQAAQSQYAEDQIQGAVLNILPPGNESLTDLMTYFLETWQGEGKAYVACFYEQKPSNVGAILGGNRIQSERIEKFSLSRDHFGMNKFGRPEEEDFQTVCEFAKPTYNSDNQANKVVPSDPTAAAQAAAGIYTGHYSNSSLKSVANYVQRPTLSEQLRKQLCDPSVERSDARPEETEILVIWGLGGAGKSQLVLDYLQKHRRDYTATFWIEAGRKESVERDFLKIYQLLFLGRAPPGQQGLTVDDVVTIVKDWFGRHGGRRLLVFDSADLVDNEDDSSYYDLRDFIPDSPSLHVIITTRNSSLKDISKLDGVEVGVMEKSEAAELFWKSSKIKDKTGQSRTEIDLIVQELGYLALAISLAGSYVSATPRLSRNIQEYLPEYRVRRKELLRQKPKRMVHAYGASVLTTWETSFDTIVRECPEAADVLGISAFLNNDDILLTFFDLGACREKENKADKGIENELWQLTVFPQQPFSIYTLEEAFRCLQTFSLVQWKDDVASYSMHRLVHAWSSDRLDEGKQRRYCGAALRLLENVVLGSGSDPGYKLRLRPHLMVNFTAVSRVYDKMGTQDETILGSLDVFSDCIHGTGQWADVYLVKAFLLTTRRKMYGEEHPKTISAMNNLANTLSDQGRLDEAASMQQEVLEKLRGILGHKHPDTILAINNLANTLHDQGSLANTLHDQGRLDEAASMQQKVLEKLRRILGDNHPSTIIAMSNLASTLRIQGQLDETASMQQKVLEKLRRILGDEHPKTILAIGSLANTLHDQGRLGEAASMQQEVLEKLRRILGDNHPDTISVMSNLASTLSGQGQLDKAASMEQEVLEKRRLVLGDDHPNTITAMSNLASPLSDQGYVMMSDEELGLDTFIEQDDGDRL
ncbi:MAG: hypothetical protein Q9178_007178 [Gyalolechia marmorata]